MGWLDALRSDVCVTRRKPEVFSWEEIAPACLYRPLAPERHHS